MMTPEQLREMEQSLAFEQATSLIENHCLSPMPAGEEENGWFDLDSSDIDLGDEAEYLASRGLLQRHSDIGSLVILRNESEPLTAAEQAVQA